MKTILITGAAGFIGRRMTLAAQAAGWRVIGLDRTEGGGADGGRQTAEGGAGLGATGYSGDWIVADITAETPINLPAGIDAIIHLAGKAHALAEVAQDTAEYFQINTEGTRRMLEAAQRAGVRAFVLFSTVKAAGDRPPEVAGSEKREVRGNADDGGRRTEDGENRRRMVDGGGREPENRGAVVGRQSPVVCRPLDEFCSAPPDTPYGQSKRAAEGLVLAGGYVPHPVVLRPCLVYGPTPKGNLDKMIEAVKRGRFPPLPEVGNKRSMVHIDDVIAAALLAAEHPAAQGQVFIVGDNEPFSTRQLFEWICKAAGRKVPRWTVPLWGLRLLGRTGDVIGKLRGRRFVFDSDALAKLTGNAWYSSAKLQRELGWRPRHTLRETMPSIVEGRADDGRRK
jgi:nucleoside-diphosphate-sugar epimerase